jgi:hypothetical protein
LENSTKYNAATTVAPLLRPKSRYLLSGATVVFDEPSGGDCMPGGL